MRYLIVHPHGNKITWNKEIAGMYQAAGYQVYTRE
jgi:hypothetical protein